MVILFIQLSLHLLIIITIQQQIHNQMKKLILLTIGISILLGSCTSSKEDIKENDWKQYKLSDKVKSLKATTYKAVEKFGEIEKGDIIPSFENKQLVFNLEGKITEENLYDSDGGLLHKDEYKYDMKGIIIEINRYDSDGSLFEKTLSKNDEKGNLVESNIYDSDGNLSSKIVFKCDKEGKINEYNIYDSDGNLEQKYLIKYDKEGNQVELNLYDSDGSHSTKNKYDEKGNQVEMIVYRSDGSFSYNNLYKYDKKGNLTENISVDKLDQKWEYKYEYEFDNKGNWIKKIEFLNNMPRVIIEREIEYFD